MKKIVFLLIVVAIAMLPLIGNKVVKNSITQRLDTLNSYGLSSNLTKEEKSYLSTTLHYKLTITDEKKFLGYLEQYSSKQFPPYTRSLLDGVVFAIELSYSNIPFNEQLKISLYPEQLSDSTMKTLRKESPQIAKFLTNLLQKRALQYNLEYGVVSGEFNGRLKDFNQQFTLEDTTKIAIQFSGVHTHGKGMLLTPELFSTTAKKFNVAIEQKQSNFNLMLKEITTTSSFESDTTYITSIAAKNLDIEASENNKTPLKVKLVNFTTNLSSNTQSQDGEFFTKSSCESLSFSQANQSYSAKGINYELSLKKLQKKSYVKLHKLADFASNATITPAMQKQALENLVELIGYGLELQVSDLSLKTLTLSNNKTIQGFKANLKLHLKRDDNFVQNFHNNMAEVEKNLTLKAKIALSKELYILINQLYPVEIMFANYKNIQNNTVVFDVAYKDGIYTINNKKVQ